MSKINSEENRKHLTSPAQVFASKLRFYSECLVWMRENGVWHKNAYINQLAVTVTRRERAICQQLCF